MNLKQPSFRSRLVKLNILSIVGSLLICLTIFIFLIYQILNSYIKNELDFVLSEMSSNFNLKTTLMEDVILDIRKNETLIDYLSNQTSGLVDNENETQIDIPVDSQLKNQMNGQIESSLDTPLDNQMNGQIEAIQEEFEREVDIYSNKNTKKIGIPFLDMVYLFDNSDQMYPITYSEHLLSTQKDMNLKQQLLYKNFIAQEHDVFIVSEDLHTHIIYSLYDKQIDKCGTIIFSINNEAISKLMEKSLDYDNAFWYVFDKFDSILLHDGIEHFTNQDFQTLNHNFTSQTESYLINKTDFMVFTEPLNMGIGSVVGIPSDQLYYLVFETIRPYIFIIVIILICLCFGIFAIALQMTKPLKEIADKLHEVEKENFNVKLPPYNNQELHTISTTFNSMTATIKHLITDVYEKKLLLVYSELDIMRSQLNPHFMYNVLNTISLKAQMDGNIEVATMITNFSKLTQSRITNKDTEKITIEQELQYVEFYLSLQKHRFEDNLNYKINVKDSSLLKLFIPKLTLEMITENAIIHGIEPKGESSNLLIEVWEQNETVFITIEDDGVGFQNRNGIIPLPITDFKTDDTKHSHIAINNSYALLKHYYGGDYGLQIETRENIGTKVTIKLPKDSNIPNNSVPRSI